MKVLDYELPPSAIAQEPAEPRSSARLLVATGAPGGEPRHATVADLPDLLEPGDLLVVNETKVLPARLRLSKPSGGAVEVLLLERNGGMEGNGRLEGDGGAGDPAAAGWGEWEALVRPGRRVAPGTELMGDDGAVVAEVGASLPGGRRRVRLRADPARHGVVPLPPYIRRPLADPTRYQTVYATSPGSVAAPTAGLHLTAEVLERCRRRGVATAAVDLAVGLDTFRPLTVSDADDHVMHTERYRVPAATWEACHSARRVVAVGTTTVRALESVAATGHLEGRTALFIRGDYPFAVVDVLLTNFHQPRSSLLLLVAAFAGERWRRLYATALAEGYRFLSFGDAMLVARTG